MNYTQYALKKLKGDHFKITRPREMIVRLLDKSERALTPYEMRDYLNGKKIKADVVTIYRVLETLEKLSLAHKVLAFGGYIACNMNNQKKGDAIKRCHHYLICNRCHRVDEVRGEDLSKLEKRIAGEHQFNIQSHYIEFIGLCKKCREFVSRKR